MKKLIHFTTILLAVLIMACNQNKKSDYSKQVEIKEPSVAYSASSHLGKKLMETKCYVCHNPSTDHDSRTAPPMVAIKSHYIGDDTTKEEFVSAMWNFVKEPSKDKAKMRGAVKRFGVMPYQPFSEEEIKLISEYIYDFKIEEPEWFKEHIEEESKGKMKYRNDGKSTASSASQKTQTIAERGLQYALNTKKELGKNLMGTIQKKGTKEAVTFCNIQAYPITDSMAVAQNATIKRVSDKPRNPNNQASTKELDIIAQFKKAIANNEDYKPITEVENGKVTFYAPILTNSMCLQCHGTPRKTIQPEVFRTITNHYPEDKAIGYDVNEVRGMWSITYNQ
ncbi:MAG: c-type heme family protein [bacterium]